jgi:cytochrome P450
MWVVTRYEDVRAALTDPRLAKDVHRWPGGSRSRPSEADNLHAHMLHSDPPDHARLRRPVQKAFTPRLAAPPHPAELARLRADPSLLPAAVEELLRFANPLKHATDRFTTEDVTIGEVVIPAGEWVLIATSSANRDPARFPDPDRLDLGRDASGHVAFGYGIHYCLGAPLARMEAEVALGALLPRFPGMSLAVPPEELRWRPVSLMHGLESLPVRLA